MTCRNKYFKGTEDKQMTPNGYPNYNFYIKNLRFFYPRQTEKLIWGGLGNYVPPGRHKSYLCTYVTYVRHIAEFPLNSSKMEFPLNFQNWVPTKRYSTKNTNRITNHRVLVPVTYQYQPDSQYWWKFLPLSPHLPTIPIYLYIAIAYARTSCNDIIMNMRLGVMSIHSHRKRNAEAQPRRCQNPA